MYKDNVTMAYIFQENAKKCLKRTIWKWKVYHNRAAIWFAQAAQCYRMARKMKESSECYIKAAQCLIKTGSYYYTARHLENAMLVIKEISSPEEIFRLTKCCGDCYHKSGYILAGSKILNKGGDLIVDCMPEKALILFESAVRVALSTDGQHDAIDYIPKVSRTLARLNWYDECVKSLLHDFSFRLEKSVLTKLLIELIVVHLSRKNFDDAANVLKRYKLVLDVPTYIVLSSLLNAYEYGDCKLAAKVLRHKCFSTLEPEFIELIQRLPPPQCKKKFIRKAVSLESILYNNFDKADVPVATVKRSDPEILDDEALVRQVEELTVPRYKVHSIRHFAYHQHMLSRGHNLLC